MSLNSDTSPEAQKILLAGLRAMPPWLKLRQACELTSTCTAFCLAGIRARNPRISEKDLVAQFSSLHLGAVLAAKVYGSK